MSNVLPTVSDVVDAEARMRGRLVETPVLESEAINVRVGARVLFKAECLQHTGSFKIRGALNRLLQLSSDERAAGVVAFSSGNHAQAVALAARWLRVHATIVMPADAPKVKLERTRELGAEVVLYDREREDREAIAVGIAERRGAALVPPFDHPHIIAGQGTLALELVRAARARHATIDAFYAPCSGGGLVAGCALALKAEWPSCAVYAVEPRGFEDHAASLAAGGAANDRARRNDVVRRAACADAGRDHVRDQSPRCSRARALSMTARFAPPWRSPRIISKSSSSLPVRPRSRRCSRSRGSRVGASPSFYREETSTPNCLPRFCAVAALNEAPRRRAK